MEYVSYKDFLASVLWADLRDAKLKVNPRCEKYGESRFLNVHHTHYRRRWQDTQVEDLETLCRECHAKQHDAPHVPQFPQFKEQDFTAPRRRRERRKRQRLTKPQVVFTDWESARRAWEAQENHLQPIPRSGFAGNAASGHPSSVKPACGLSMGQ